MWVYVPVSAWLQFKTHANRKHLNWQQIVSIQGVQISEEPVSHSGQTQEDDLDHHDEAMDVDDMA